jgi:hypothetical protein
LVQAHEIAVDLLREAVKPRFLVGFVCACAVFAAFFPLLYCPCVRVPGWLAYLSLSGFILWFVSALVGTALPATSEQRVFYLVATLAAPLAFWVMLSLGVSH